MAYLTARMFMLIAFIIACCAFPVYAADMLPRLSGEASSEERWNELERLNPFLESKSSPDGFRFEVLRLDGAQNTREIRQVSNGDHLYCSGDHGLILGLLGSEMSVSVKENRFIVGAGTGVTNHATLLINEVMREKSPEVPVKWDRRTRLLSSRLKNAGHCVVALRTPNDSERWQCGWQFVEVLAADGTSVYESRRFQLGTDELQELKAIDKEWLDQWSQSGSVEDWPLQAELLFGRLTSRELVYRRLGIPSPEFWKGASQNRMRLAADAVKSTSELSAAAVEYFPALERELPFWASCYEKLFNREGAVMCIDDPCVQYWISELVCGNTTLVSLHQFWREQILKRSDLPLATRVLACSAIGRMGRPAVLFESFGAIADRQLMEAIVFAHWQKPVTDAHVHALVDALKSSRLDREGYYCIIDALAALDELGCVDDENASEWWAAHIRRPQAQADWRDDLRVWYFLCSLSRNRSGRDFMAHRIESSSIRLGSAIRRCLLLRAESTTRLGRYDFISEEECTRILKISRVRNPGVDIDGGDARPFPVD